MINFKSNREVLHIFFTIDPMAGGGANEGLGCLEEVRPTQVRDHRGVAHLESFQLNLGLAWEDEGAPADHRPQVQAWTALSHSRHSAEVFTFPGSSPL